MLGRCPYYRRLLRTADLALPNIQVESTREAHMDQALSALVAGSKNAVYSITG